MILNGQPIIQGCPVSELNCPKQRKLVQISWQKKNPDQYLGQRWTVGRFEQRQVKFDLESFCVEKVVT